MKVTAFVAGAFFLSLLVGCKDEGNPSNEVDPQLLGEWYYLDTMAISYPAPTISFRGMRINEDKTIHVLGIETATGKVALIENAPTKELLMGNGGVLVIRYVAAPGMFLDTSNYRVQGDRLILTGRYTNIAYRRTHLGSMFNTPTRSELGFTMDSIEFRSPNVAALLPAFVSRISSSVLRLDASIPNGWITIDIEPFNGLGTYQIGANKGTLTQFSGDVVFSLTTDSLATGTISVDQYDEVSHRCSGEFGLTVGRGTMVRQLRDGTFSVPVYQ
jgi:hypothetical protein